MRPGSWNIDRSHPLAQGLVRALLFSEKAGGLVDAVTNVRYPLGGAALPTWDYGGMKFNGAVGTTSYVDIADGPVIGANQDLSVFCSIRNAGYANVSQHYGEVIYCERAATGNDIFKVQMGGTISYDRGSRAHFIWRNDAGNIMEVRGGEIADGLPHTIALVVTGTSVQLVTDGTRIDNGTRVVGSFTNANIKSRVCGDVASLPGSNNDGYLDLLLLYNRAISPAEIALLADRTDHMLGGLIVEERPVLYFDMGGAGTDALTALDLVMGSPVLGTPALGQVHALTAQGLAVGSPVLGSPAIGQAHVLTAQNFTASSPALGAPAVGQVHALTANNLTVSSPVLGSPALVENAADVDALTANALVVGSPALGSQSLGQIHVLGSDGLVTGPPVLGSPTITQVHALAALGLTVGVPVLGTPTLADYEVTAITADEVARVVSSQSRMKIVMAASRQKQVIYAVS